MSKSYYRSIHVLFKASHIRELAWHKDLAPLRNIMPGRSCNTPKEVFESVYEELLDDYMIEYVLKNELLKFLRKRNPGEFIGTEFHIGLGGSIGEPSKIDAVVIGDTGTAFEIKSRFDRTDRLESQINAYSKVFDKIVLVTEKFYSERFVKRIPSWVGHYEISPIGVSVCRAPKVYTKNLRARDMLSSMYKPERIAFVKRVNAKAKYVPTYYRDLSRTLAMSMKPTEMNEHFCWHLKTRNKPIRCLQFLPELPDCFTAALYDYWLLQRDIKSLIEVMDAPLYPNPNE